MYAKAYILRFCSKSLAEFAARRRQKIESIFSHDMCVRENTSQAASVEFLRCAQKLCAQQTASLLSEKPGGFFDSPTKTSPGRDAGPDGNNGFEDTLIKLNF